MSTYPFTEIEKKWQDFWDKNQTFKVTEDPTVPADKRLYVLDMFPYPSGEGLHVGHPEGYTATDIYCRYLRMNGYNVLHPMGFDSLVYRLKTTPLKPAPTPARLPRGISTTSATKLRVSVSATTGVGKYQPIVKSTTNGPSGSSFNSIKRGWLTRLKPPSTGAPTA